MVKLEDPTIRSQEGALNDLSSKIYLKDLPKPMIEIWKGGKNPGDD